MIGVQSKSVYPFATAWLLRYRNGDANPRSVWLCSRNDTIGNVAVIIAAVIVQQLQSAWPDLLVAFLMALLFLHSAYLIIRQARSEMLTDSLALVRAKLNPE